MTVRTRADLEQRLTSTESLAQHESVYFGGLKCDDDTDGAAAVSDFVPDVARQVAAAGIVPVRSGKFADVGARVETIAIGGRSSPACRYGVGTVISPSWRRVERA